MELKITVKGRFPSMNEYTEAQRVSPYSGANLKKKFQNIVLGEILSIGRIRLSPPVYIHYRFCEKNRRRDKDNIAGFAHKVVQDALVKAGTIPDDKWDMIAGFSDDFILDWKNPRVEITVKEAEDYMTQRERVLQYIRETGSITRMDAAVEIGCHELASRIGELEAQGYKFTKKTEKGKNRYGDPTHWTRYSLKEQS